MDQFENEAPIMAVRKFQRLLGASRTTVFRYRARKWLHTINIGGKPYVTRAAIQDFVTRAEAGEFSNNHHRNQVRADHKQHEP